MYTGSRGCLGVHTLSYTYRRVHASQASKCVHTPCVYPMHTYMQTPMSAYMGGPAPFLQMQPVPASGFFSARSLAAADHSLEA